MQSSTLHAAASSLTRAAQNNGALTRTDARRVATRGDRPPPPASRAARGQRRSSLRHKPRAVSLEPTEPLRRGEAVRAADRAPLGRVLGRGLGRLLGRALGRALGGARGRLQRRLDLRRRAPIVACRRSGSGLRGRVGARVRPTRVRVRVTVRARARARARARVKAGVPSGGGCQEAACERRARRR